MNIFTAVPQQLQVLPNWIVWKLETRHGKDTKVPYDAKSNGKAHCAKSNDASTWTTFKRAVDAADVFNGSDYDGIGLMLQGTNLVGTDFDGVLHDGVAEPFVLAILEKLGNPYCEITPSGNGLRTFVQCAALPPGQRKFTSNKYGAEIYSGAEKGRYLTVTGNHFSGDGIPTLDDISIAYFMVSQIANKKLKALWMGGLSEYGNDDSRADFALLGILARVFDNNAQKMEWAFNASTLGQREKWTGRKDYRDRTIKNVLGGEEPTNAPKETSEPQGATQVISKTGSSIKPKRIKWLWENRVPLGKITLFAGNPDNGKSLAANSIAAICTTGRPFPDSPNTVPASNVLMMLGEDDLEDTAAPRLMAAGADMSKIEFIESVLRGNGPDDPKLDVDMPALEAKIQEFPNARLLVIDPISNYLGDTSMFGEQNVRSEILVPLKKLAEKYNIAIVIVMHLNKKAELDAINRVGGAMAFIGVARCSWMFVRDAATEDGETKDSFSMSRIKNNLISISQGGLSYKIEAKAVFHDDEGGVWAPFVVWGDTVQKSADQALGATRREAHRPKGTDSKTQVAVRFLEKALADGARRHRKELETAAYETAGITPKTLRDAQGKLGIKPEGKGKNWTWALPNPAATPEAKPVDAGDNLPPITREFRLQ